MPSSQTSRSGTALRWTMIAIAGWLVLRVAGCMLMVPGAWGPEVRGALPGGGEIIYQSRPVGRETDDRLTWIRPDGSRNDYWVQQYHAGPAFVTLMLADDATSVWVVDKGKVAASLDLTTGSFAGELATGPDGKQTAHGKVLASGRTWSIRHLLLPW